MDKLDVLIPETAVRAKIEELAAKINQDYAGKELLVVGILRGAFIFLADLARKLKMPVIIDFIAVSSYGQTTHSSGVVRILKDLDESVAGQYVLLVEDIIDSGLTLKYLSEYLRARHPADLRVCTLLDKPDRRKVDFQPDYNGFTIPDYFVVGYGLDCGQRYRNLPGIYVIHPDDAAGREETAFKGETRGGGAGMVADRDLIYIVDFGAQYTQLIARRIREANVYCEIVPFTKTWAELRASRPRGLVFSGGPASVYAPGAPRCDPELLSGEVPVLGICYGMQLMAFLLGGTVSGGGRREYGPARLTVVCLEPLFSGLPREISAWMSHGDRVDNPPPGFLVAAKTTDAVTAAMFDPVRRLYGVQFHPEVQHTPQGKEILAHFLYQVCGCKGDWTPASFVEEQIIAIRQAVGRQRVVGALSGGVDSNVAAALVHRAIGDQLTCIFVDHGLLRKGEKEEVEVAFRESLGMKIITVAAPERFLNKLQGVVDPEQKRRIIGNEFVRVFEEEAVKIGEASFLLQGTLYPDVIESGTATAAAIKTHHNVGGIPADLKLTLLEPLRWLFKDEVRQVGLELGLPEAIVWRQPFPGPGLAVRVPSEITDEKLVMVREADWILRQEVKQAGLERSIWQFFTVLLPVRSVGVMGDDRTYAHPIVIRAVTSEDAMTADWARLPYDLLGRISSRIVNEVPGVNRVLYDITSKPPATIEWE